MSPIVLEIGGLQVEAMPFDGDYLVKGTEQDRLTLIFPNTLEIGEINNWGPLDSHGLSSWDRDLTFAFNYFWPGWRERINAVRDTQNLKSPTVYLVTMGDCECGHNLGFFSTRELAQAFVDSIIAAKAGEIGNPAIVEHVLDSAQSPTMPKWSVELNQDGSVVECRPEPFYYRYGEPEDETANYSYDTGLRTQIHVSTFQPTEELAVAFAREQLALSKRLGCWEREGDWFIENGKLVVDES